MTVLGVVLLVTVVAASAVRTVVYLRRSHRSRPKGGQP